jgi:hypothetical protein
MLFVLKMTYLIMRDCANIRQEAWRVLARLAHIHRAVLRGLARLAHIHQRTIWKNVTRIRHIRMSNLPFLQIWGEWPLFKFYALYQIVCDFYFI